MYVTIPGYQFLYKNGEQNRNDGVGISLKDDTSFKERNYINALDSTIEHL